MSTFEAVDKAITRMRRSRWFRALSRMRELIVLLAFYLALARPAFTRPQLEASILRIPLARALFVNPALDSRAHLSGAVAQFDSLISAQDLTTIDLTNTSPTRIDDLVVTLSGVSSVANVGGEASWLRSRQNLRSLFAYVHDHNTITFPHLRELPARGTVKIVIWNTHLPAIGTGLAITSNAHSKHIVDQAVAGRLARYIDDNIIAILVLAVAITALIGLRRFSPSPPPTVQEAK